jgi:hypothetical protein
MLLRFLEDANPLTHSPQDHCSVIPSLLKKSQNWQILGLFHFTFLSDKLTLAELRLMGAEKDAIEEEWREIASTVSRSWCLDFPKKTDSGLESNGFFFPLAPKNDGADKADPNNMNSLPVVELEFLLTYEEKSVPPFRLVFVRSKEDHPKGEFAFNYFFGRKVDKSREFPGEEKEKSLRGFLKRIEGELFVPTGNMRKLLA